MTFSRGRWNGNTSHQPSRWGLDANGRFQSIRGSEGPAAGRPSACSSKGLVTNPADAAVFRARPLTATPLQAEAEILPFSRLIVVFGIMIEVFGDPELAPVFFHETIHAGIFMRGGFVDVYRHARALRNKNQTAFALDAGEQGAGRPMACAFAGSVPYGSTGERPPPVRGGRPAARMLVIELGTALSKTGQ